MAASTHLIQQLFHPAVSSWFESRFAAATPVQEQAWQQIQSGENSLIAAPTGSGKTFAAFLAAIDALVKEAQQQPLADEVRILYVSPLKALSNDIERNLQDPLKHIEQTLAQGPWQTSGIQVRVRTGDTSQGEREKMRRKPPQILVTTPESLYLLLTAASGRNMLANVETVIVDEIHALAPNKRGSHLSLSLARLDALCAKPPQRIGLSATQNPIQRIARFLTGGKDNCRIIDTGHKRDWDIRLELPDAPVSAVMANEVWEEIYNRLEHLIAEHHTCLIFVNTRRLAERAARHLAERIGEDRVTAHHGSLARKHRLHAEQRLKAGELKALVATASLELGIDIGHVDLVCQLGSPRAISAFLQRVGRAGHNVGETSKGRLFPLSRDELVECTALLDAVHRGELDEVSIPGQPLDVLAQHVVAELSARDWGVEPLYRQLIKAWPYRDLSRDGFDQVIDMLAQGYSTRRGRRAALIYHDAVNGELKGRPNARLTALMNGGAIPDQFDYDVILQPQGHFVGTLNEDFAFESLPGNIFQLGNTSYLILKIEQGRVFVADAQGMPPNIPFWFGDAPGRSDMLSMAVSRLRQRIDQALADQEPFELATVLSQDLQQPLSACQQLVEYLAAGRATFGHLPSQQQLVLERFFDEAGDMHLVLHSPFGSRLNRAWGLALRKRFCRKFNFELQAAALEDTLILSLGETHSFTLEEVMNYLKPETVEDVLTQALLDAPMFAARWRWNATIALAVQRMRNGKKVAPQLQRSAAEDLIAVVFPDQLACLENIRGAREIPDHPLVSQTIADCLHETMDIDGLKQVLDRVRAGDIAVSCHDLNGPSPLCQEIINARPYAFLDDAPAEERRTAAIARSSDDLAEASRLGVIQLSAVETVQTEAWISPRSPDELHDALLQLGFLTATEALSGGTGDTARADASHWPVYFKKLSHDNRACRLLLEGDQWMWVAAERLAELQRVYPDASHRPAIKPYGIPPDQRATALLELLRSRLAGLGPVTLDRLVSDFVLPETDITSALLALENEGWIMRTTLNGLGQGGEYWCERRLLARIHRYSRSQRRKQVRPVSAQAMMRFLVRWHGLDEPPRGKNPLWSAFEMLQGWAAPLVAWEHELLPARVPDADPLAIDQYFLNGQLVWFRSSGPVEELVAAGPIAICRREQLECWLPGAGATHEPVLSGAAEQVENILQQSGARFAGELMSESGLLEPQFEAALENLIAQRRISADSLSALRALLRNETQKRRQARWRRAGAPAPLMGRWSRLPEMDRNGHGVIPQPLMDGICRTLLKRYGVVFRRLLEREPLLPSWRQLLYYLRRLEDRGEVLGGRFVDGFSGEQFALPEAAALLRKLRKPGSGGTITVNACDPLNLAGIITPGRRTPARLGNAVLLQDGLPVARRVGQVIERLDKHCRLSQIQIEQRLGTVHIMSGNQQG